MAKCNYCNTSTWLGGQRDGKLFFCDDDCQISYTVMPYAQQVPAEKMTAMIHAMHMGACPKCKKQNGKVDVHNAYRVWSAAVISSWGTHPEPSCKSCAIKRQVGSIFFSSTLGWWGFPWGLIVTPVQITRNLIGMLLNPQKKGPSESLANYVKLTVGQKIAEDQLLAQSQNQAQNPTVPHSK